MRAGPFFVLDNALEGLVYRGQATAVTWTMALT
jgi:hypothetical protein